MENLSIARGAALLVLPMIVASCGGSDQGLIETLPDQDKAGCTDTPVSCDTVFSGVVAKVVLTDTGEAAIRFATFDGDVETQNGIYTDGVETVIFTNGVGDEGEEGGFLQVGTYSGFGGLILEDTPNILVTEDGVFGANTDGNVVPIAGVAFYEGDAYAVYYDNITQSLYLDDAFSELTVNFAQADADLRIQLFNNNITEFDAIYADNMTITGYTFTGSEVRLMEDVLAVPTFDVTSDVLGVNLDSASAGMFFGPVNGDGNPEEFGAVTVVNGSDGFVFGVAVGAVDDDAPLPD